MKLKIASILGLSIASISVVYLFQNNLVFSNNIVAIIIQVLAAGLMIWARITFGLRSFHAAANTTEGKLVTTGPYRWLRHPIYAAIIYFFWASVISYPLGETIFAVSMISGGLFLRMVLEEKSLVLTYDKYKEYSKRSKRLIPFIF